MEFDKSNGNKFPVLWNVRQRQVVRIKQQINLESSQSSCGLLLFLYHFHNITSSTTFLFLPLFIAGLPFYVNFSNPFISVQNIDQRTSLPSTDKLKLMFEILKSLLIRIHDLSSLSAGNLVESSSWISWTLVIGLTHFYSQTTHIIPFLIGQ